MNRTLVNSSTIHAIGYDPDTLTLELEFIDETVYEYSGVPAWQHAELRTASSIGTYFNLHIRNGPYPCRRLS